MFIYVIFCIYEHYITARIDKKEKRMTKKNLQKVGKFNKIRLFIMLVIIETVPLLNKQSKNILQKYHGNARILLAFKYFANIIVFMGVLCP